jgi:hypothetical protein
MALRRIGLALAATLLMATGPVRAEMVDVDVELVLAVDVSRSMTDEEQALQRRGYAQALTSPEFLDALRLGLHHRIALSYIEWSGVDSQWIVVDWSLVEGAGSARSVADRITQAPMRRASRTSISGAIDFGSRLFGTSVYRGDRRVIDISGDGPNNQGRVVTAAREDALAKGIVINGLPILSRRGAGFDVPNLDLYYAECVIGGEGSFSEPATHIVDFVHAARIKLVREVAGLPLPPIVRAAETVHPFVDCFIGDRIQFGDTNPQP